MNHSEIKSADWKYHSGAYFGRDVLQFEHHLFKNDTIFEKGVPKFVIIEIQNSFFSVTKLKLKSIQSQQIGTFTPI